MLNFHAARNLFYLLFIYAALFVHSINLQAQTKKVMKDRVLVSEYASITNKFKVLLSGIGKNSPKGYLELAHYSEDRLNSPYLANKCYMAALKLEKDSVEKERILERIVENGQKIVKIIKEGSWDECLNVRVVSRWEVFRFYDFVGKDILCHTDGKSLVKINKSKIQGVFACDPGFTESLWGNYTAFGRFKMKSIRIDKLDKKHTSLEDKMQQIRHYCSSVPGLEQCSDEALDDLLFAVANNSKSNESFKQYLISTPLQKSQNPNHDYARYFVAKSSDSKEELQRYLNDFSHGNFRAKAAEDIEYIDFREAAASGSIEALTNFIAENPGSKFSENAREMTRKMRFEIASAANTVSSFQSFLDLYPEGMYSESADWNIAILEKDSDSFAEHLVSFPNSQYKFAAQAAVAYFALLDDPTLDKYQTFFENDLRQKVSFVTPEEREELVSTFATLAWQEKSANALILCYKVNDDPAFLEYAQQFVKDKETELMLLKEAPQLYLHFDVRSAEPNAKKDYSFFFSNPIIKVNPVISVDLQSHVVYGQYQVIVDIDLETKNKRWWSGIMWFKPDNFNKEWKSSYKKTAYFNISPGQNVTSAAISFPEVIIDRTEGIKAFYSAEYQSEITDLNLSEILVEAAK